MGRRLTESKSIEKNLKKKIELEKLKEKIKNNIEKVKQKPVKVLDSKGNIIQIIKNQ